MDLREHVVVVDPLQQVGQGVPASLSKPDVPRPLSFCPPARESAFRTREDLRAYLLADSVVVSNVPPIRQQVDPSFGYAGAQFIAQLSHSGFLKVVADLANGQCLALIQTAQQRLSRLVARLLDSV